jgi:hypothetical protein
VLPFVAIAIAPPGDAAFAVGKGTAPVPQLPLVLHGSYVGVVGNE